MSFLERMRKDSKNRGERAHEERREKRRHEQEVELREMQECSFTPRIGGNGYNNNNTFYRNNSRGEDGNINQQLKVVERLQRWKIEREEKIKRLRKEEVKKQKEEREVRGISKRRLSNGSKGIESFLEREEIRSRSKAKQRQQFSSAHNFLSIEVDNPVFKSVQKPPKCKKLKNQKSSSRIKIITAPQSCRGALQQSIFDTLRTTLGTLKNDTYSPRISHSKSRQEPLNFLQNERFEEIQTNRNSESNSLSPSSRSSKNIPIHEDDVKTPVLTEGIEIKQDSLKGQRRSMSRNASKGQRKSSTGLQRLHLKNFASNFKTYNFSTKKQGRHRENEENEPIEFILTKEGVSQFDMKDLPQDSIDLSYSLAGMSEEPLHELAKAVNIEDAKQEGNLYKLNPGSHKKKKKVIRYTAEKKISRRESIERNSRKFVK